MALVLTANTLLSGPFHLGHPTGRRDVEQFRAFIADLDPADFTDS